MCIINYNTFVCERRVRKKILYILIDCYSRFFLFFKSVFNFTYDFCDFLQFGDKKKLRAEKENCIRKEWYTRGRVYKIIFESFSGCSIMDESYRNLKESTLIHNYIYIRWWYNDCLTFQFRKNWFFVKVSFFL